MNGDRSQTASLSTGLDPTPSRLLVRLKAQDAQSWQRLADLYGPLVWYWCRRSGLQAQDAADVMQELFLSAWSAIGHFQHQPGQGRFRAWLWTIARHKICDHYRRRASEPGARGGTDAQIRLVQIPEQAPEEAAEPAARQEVKSLYGRALAIMQSEFEETTWKAFWLAGVEGRPTAEVASVTGLSTASVRQAKCRVLRRLREELGDVI